jgi:vacuolar-type H+-ATPase subunit D/Vma8
MTDTDILRRWNEAMADMNTALETAVREVQSAAERLERLAEELREDARRV